MTTNFNWNHIPGVHVETEQPPKVSNTDQFDDFFNSQLTQTTQQQPQPISRPTILIPSDHKPPNTSRGYSENALSSAFKKLNLDNPKSHSDDTINTIKNVTTNANSNSSVGLSLSNIMEHPTHSSSTDTIIADNDSTIPLSLSLNDMTQKELKTYLRWYENIQQRKISNKTVTIDDVFIFMHNFKIPQQTKERMKRVFSKWASSLNIGQFFALMRLLAHALLGEPLARSLIKKPAAVPRPSSILSSKRKGNSIDSSRDPSPVSIDEPKKKLDIDSFTEFILTGERPSARPPSTKSNKKVKFSEVVTFSQPPQVNDDASSPVKNIPLINPPQQHVLDFSLPMDQLLDKLKAESTGGQATQTQQAQTQPPITVTQPTENEEEVLKDVHLDTFKNITQKATQAAGADEPLKPNLTGSASKSMKEHFLQKFDQTFNFNSASNSFQPSYGSISSLSAVPSLVAPITQSPLLSPNADGSLTPLSLQANLNTSQYQLPQATSSANVQYPESKQSQPAQPPQQDYFGIVPQQMASVSTPIFQSASQVSALQPPPRSRASSTSSPSPPPPPPPRSRKNSRAPTVPNNLSSVNSVNVSHPVLPPKPVLNEHQKQQYISVSDSGANQMTLTNMNPNLSGYAVTASSTGTNNNGMDGINNTQMQQLNQITQLQQQTGRLNNVNNAYNNMNNQMLYGQQANIGQSPQFSNQFFNQQTGGGWPSQQQQQQQPQQLYQQHPSQQQQQQQNAWAGWHY